MFQHLYVDSSQSLFLYLRYSFAKKIRWDIAFGYVNPWKLICLRHISVAFAFRSMIFGSSRSRLPFLTSWERWTRLAIDRDASRRSTRLRSRRVSPHLRLSQAESTLTHYVVAFFRNDSFGKTDKSLLKRLYEQSLKVPSTQTHLNPSFIAPLWNFSKATPFLFLETKTSNGVRSISSKRANVMTLVDSSRNQRVRHSLRLCQSLKARALL